MSRRNLLGLLAIAPATFLVLLLLGGGGRSGGVLDPVAQAASATAGAGSAEVGMAGSMTIAGQTIPLNGSALIDMKNLKARITFNTNIGSTGPITVEEILNGPVIYMKMPGLSDKLPGGKPWLKLDLQKLGKSHGIDFAKLMQSNGGSQNPADMLRYLKAVGTSTVVGHEGIRGAPTTHYRANIDLNKALGRVGNAQTEATLKQLFTSSGLTSIPVDVWVDREGLVRRESLNMSFTAPGTGAESINMTMDFIRFGVQVDASPPPGDQVLDVGSMLDSLGPKS